MMVWYAHLFNTFPQFVMIHTVKGFSIVNEAEVNVFWNSFATEYISLPSAYKNKYSVNREVRFEVINYNQGDRERKCYFRNDHSDV